VAHLYKAYGLAFASNVVIPALSLLSSEVAEPDFIFQTGTPPQWVSQSLNLPAKQVPTFRHGIPVDDPSFRLTDYGAGQFFQLAYVDGTRFVVDGHGTRVWGEPGPGLTPGDVFVYLVGPIMGFVLRRRGRTIPLHASSVSIEGQAVALFGEAGAGKSTTAAALALRGWPVLCEDVCALEHRDQRIHVLPGYPRICLWPDSVGFLFSAPDALPLIVEGWEKRYLQLDGERAQFRAESLPLAAMYLLAARSNDPEVPRIEQVSQRESALYLVQNTYMNWLLDRGQRAAEFDGIANLVSRIPCFKVTPSIDPARLPDMADLIQSHAMSLACRPESAEIGRPLESDV
jgi:hypothetical protein